MRFLDGARTLQDRVLEVASEWTAHANIRFERVEEPDAEIRLSFADRGYWSHVGMDAVAVDKSMTTMSLAAFTVDTPSPEFRRVVLHEFGHALGSIHEHQNPAA